MPPHRRPRCAPSVPFPFTPRGDSLMNRSATSIRSHSHVFRPQSEGLEGRQLLTAGVLDRTFGTGGYVLTNSPGVKGRIQADSGYAVAIQPDGNILASGER